MNPSTDILSSVIASEAKQSRLAVSVGGPGALDCFVAPLLAMTVHCGRNLLSVRFGSESEPYCAATAALAPACSAACRIHSA
jgi:hypothetical protein